MISSMNWQTNIGGRGMSDPRAIIEQCDVLIAKYEEGLKLAKRLRRDAIRELNRKSRWVETEDAWGRPVRVKKTPDFSKKS